MNIFLTAIGTVLLLKLVQLAMLLDQARRYREAQRDLHFSILPERTFGELPR